MAKKLFLLDAFALIYRAHFALSKTPRVTSNGLNTSATFGFTNTLLEIITKEKPTHIGVAFDSAEKTFRHTSFEAYKAQRQEQPEDITAAVPYIIRILNAWNIPVLIMPGYEADDIIGTLAGIAEVMGFDVYMMTPDKDYCQLVTEKVKVYKPAFLGKGPEILGVKEVLERWEIEKIDQVRDILGLQGDASDNIPGIPGIGEKTAKKLIAEYGSVENLIANADKLKGKMQENVVNFAQQGILSKELATIHTEVPIAFDEQALLYKPFNKEELKAVFEELEFKTLGRRLFGEELSDSPPSKKEVQAKKEGQIGLFETPSSGTDILEMDLEEAEGAEPEIKNTIDTVVHRYHVMDTPYLHNLLATWLAKQSSFCFDSETDSLDTITAGLVGLSFCWQDKEAYYVPLPENREEAIAILMIFRPIFENPNIEKVGQNLKFDLAVLKQHGIEVNGPLFDTMLAHYLLEPDMRHGMDLLAGKYLNYTPVSITELIGKKGKLQGTMRDVPIDEIKEYAAEDADITWQLNKIFRPAIEKKGLGELLNSVELPLISVLADMESAGVNVNTAVLTELSNSLGSEVLLVEQQIYKLAGEIFNIGSPLQLGKVLFEKLKLDKGAKKTATGQYATGEEVLSRLAYEHEIAGLILEYRELLKLKNTYIDSLPNLISKQDGRIHTSYNQAVAATGRLSSTNPNLQNIPIRTAKGREIRKAFVPRDENHVLISADYSQIELRIMAAFSGDETMIQAFRDGKDIHAITASKLYKIPLQDVSSDMRRKAKTANFGIIYGISAFGLAQRLQIPRREAAEIIDNYFAEFPSIKKYMDRVINEGRENGFVSTFLGRRRYLPDINSRNQTLRGFAERNAINAPIQGTAADMIKLAMINIHNWMTAEKLESKMILQVHDELVFDVVKPETGQILEKIPALMKEAMPLAVPMDVGIGVGTNWLEAH